jgi:histone deacetylase 11
MSGCYLLLLNYSFYISKCVELPLCLIPAEYLRFRLLNSMLKATKGSMDGACLALEHGWAINLSGGYHHATRSSGGGFCIYPDITLAIHHLRKRHPHQIKKVMIIDLDAHQGNGHERDHLNDNDTHIVDVYNNHIYPGDLYAKQAIKSDVHISHYITDSEYIKLVTSNVDNAIKDFTPSFILYNAGTDCMAGDPLGSI